MVIVTHSFPLCRSTMNGLRQTHVDAVLCFLVLVSNAAVSYSEILSRYVPIFHFAQGPFRTWIRALCPQSSVQVQISVNTAILCTLWNVPEATFSNEHARYVHTRSGRIVPTQGSRLLVYPPRYRLDVQVRKPARWSCLTSPKWTKQTKNTRCSYKVNLQSTRCIPPPGELDCVQAYLATKGLSNVKADWRRKGRGLLCSGAVQKSHAETSKYPTESCTFIQLGIKVQTLFSYFGVIASKMDALDALFKLVNNSVICIW